MYLHEAVKQSLETGKYFRRPESGIHIFKAEAPNGGITIHTPFTGRFYPFWGPHVDDILADNWEMCEGDWIPDELK